MKVKSDSQVAQSCVSDSSDPMDCSPPGSSVHGIFQARVLEWGAIAFSDEVPRIIQIRDEGLIPGWEDSLEDGMATHSSDLAWRIPWTEEPDGLQSLGLERVEND